LSVKAKASGYKAKAKKLALSSRPSKKGRRHCLCCAVLQSDVGLVFNWDMKTQGHILGAFFYGYAATNFVGGMIAQKVGGKMLMLFGVLWTAVFTLLTPLFTTIGGFGAIFAVRLLEGFGEVSNDINVFAARCG